MILLKDIYRFIKTFFLIFFTTFIITLIIDFFFGRLVLSTFDTYFSKTNFYERLIRVDHKVYHHTLKPDVNYKKARSFDGYFTLCTDNHGFKYKCKKKRNKKFDIAFLGDSFVEGVALEYEKTFVGLFEKAKNTPTANLGVVSYSPSIYLSKMKFLLENDYKFNHLVVFIDVSDLYDDNSFYKLNENFSVSEKNAREKNLKRRKFLRHNFPLTNYYMYVVKMNQRLNREVPPLESDRPIFNEKATNKAKWTYLKSDKLAGYQEPISKTKSEMLYAMTELHKLLQKNDIRLSLAVYPWPQQLEFDNVNSIHVKMWENFCKKKCYKFINFFPFFFEEKKKTSFLDVYKKYYFWNDVHFNDEGNRIIAEKLLREF